MKKLLLGIRNDLKFTFWSLYIEMKLKSQEKKKEKEHNLLKWDVIEEYYMSSEQIESGVRKHFMSGRKNVYIKLFEKKR